MRANYLVGNIVKTTTGICFLELQDYQFERLYDHTTDSKERCYHKEIEKAVTRVTAFFREYCLD